MKRRNFGRALAAGAVGAVAALGDAQTAATGNKPSKSPQARMHVGCQSGGVTQKELEFRKRHGVNNIDGGSPKYVPGKGWDLNEVLAMVATAHKVRMGCHLPDPPTPAGYRGITRVLGLPKAEGMKRFIEISPSDYHGFNFCMGSFAEGLENPGTEIYEYVRYFGRRKKIFVIV